MGYYDEDYEPSEEEIEEMDSEEMTEAEFDFKNLQINFDVENFAKGIATAVKKTLKKEIIAELKKSVLEDLKDDIQKNISTMSEEIVREVYENEKGYSRRLRRRKTGSFCKAIPAEQNQRIL